jgi:hypothetical protein
MVGLLALRRNAHPMGACWSSEAVLWMQAGRLSGDEACPHPAMRGKLGQAVANGKGCSACPVLCSGLVEDAGEVMGNRFLAES